MKHPLLLLALQAPLLLLAPQSSFAAPPASPSALGAGPDSLAPAPVPVPFVAVSQQPTPPAPSPSPSLPPSAPPSSCAATESQPPAPSPALSRLLSTHATPPKLGAYFIGKYAYTDQPGQHGGDAFSQRFIRAYADGTILTHFAYRIQVQLTGSAFHMKDYFLEFRPRKELNVKIGQYKRAFLLENPLNPWDVGAGDYSQIARQTAGIGQQDGSVANGGRDQGLQLQGDLLPDPRDRHPWLHYQLQLMNGSGINTPNADRHFDYLGTLQLQPLQGLRLALFGWTGTYKSAGPSHRWAAALSCERDGWTARAEYAHTTGHNVADHDPATDTWTGTGRSDGWYATLGVPCTPWLKVYAKYDTFRTQATWATAKTIYSLIPNIQIHKNLLFQLQYNHVHNKNLAHRDYNELWGEIYVRF